MSHLGRLVKLLVFGFTRATRLRLGIPRAIGRMRRCYSLSPLAVFSYDYTIDGEIFAGRGLEMERRLPTRLRQYKLDHWSLIYIPKLLLMRCWPEGYGIPLIHIQ